MASKPKSNIGKLRRLRKLTQLELSQKVGVTETTIANWEKNRGGGLELIERFVRLCEALECQPRELLSYADDSLASATPGTSLGDVRKALGTSEPGGSPQSATALENNLVSQIQAMEQK